MSLKLTKSEIRLLRLLCKEEGTVGQLSARLKAKDSFTSRVLHMLGEKGMVEMKKEGVKKIVGLSVASHAQNFKLLSDSRPDSNLEKWLSGFAVDMLVVCGDGADTNLILEETGCSAATLYKTLKSLGAAGVLFKKNGRVEVSDRLVRNFAIAYADNIQLLALREAKGLNYSIRVRKHVLVRTDAKKIPPYFIQTGLSMLARNGLEALLTSYDDYYFAIDRQMREMSLEEAFVHALALTNSQQRQDTPVLAMFLSKNGRRLERRAIKRLAKKYLVGGALDGILQEVEFHEKMRGLE